MKELSTFDWIGILIATIAIYICLFFTLKPIFSIYKNWLTPNEEILAKEISPIKSKQPDTVRFDTQSIVMCDCDIVNNRYIPFISHQLTQSVNDGIEVLLDSYFSSSGNPYTPVGEIRAGPCPKRLDTIRFITTGQSTIY